MIFTDLTFEKDGPIATLAFNRPDRLNALRKQSRQELLQALNDYGEDSDLRVLIITGKGRAFSAGVDLKEVMQDLQRPFDEAKERASLENTFQALTRQLISLDKPVIAAINGFAVGVGLELALACDLVLAAEDAQLIFPEAQRALFQTNGVMFILPRLIGLRRAMDLLMTGRTLGAQEAQQMGLINSVVPAGQLMEKALELARTCAANAPISMCLLKNVGWAALENDIETVMKMEVEGMLECLKSEDLKEGLSAFLEKRDPKYLGK